MSGVFDATILGPPFLAGLLVLASHVPLGRMVLARGIIFIDLAVAQVAGLGVILADALGAEPEGIALQIAAGTAALAAALLLSRTEKHWPREQEAIIGSVFVLAACASLLALSGNPHGGERLNDLLTGQVLWVGLEQLWPGAVTYIALAAVWWAWPGGGRLRFYLVFALAVTVSVQLVGVYLVFASLILPALAVRELPGWKGMAAGLGVGAFAYVTGLAASAAFDLPTGPLIVLALAGMAISVRLLFRDPADEPAAPTPG
ncbi:MAG: metal ABC transporter permease [Gammaproteobacteria bacterium]|nr:metal ABC transporter permease [Gammaproteobacteria bacterium]